MIPLFANKDHAAASVFEPRALLREARRQKGLPYIDVPGVCILDPDGDLVNHLVRSGVAQIFPTWPCYHTDLYTFRLNGQTVGIVGRAVGAPFAVLVAEQLFAAGCRMLISLTSAGQIVPVGDPPYFVVIDRALRDEGTSLHYVAPSEYAEADPELVRSASFSIEQAGLPFHVGASWTTDAPFRETINAIATARAKGILAVEMEAAALYAFARRSGAVVLCLAHVTNNMGQTESDFEKGEQDGSREALAMLQAVAAGLSSRHAIPDR